MQRTRWLPPAQIDAADHFLDWESRNRVALRFHAQHPAKIAIIRSEECCTDPQVFRSLCRWLGGAGTSLFRTLLFRSLSSSPAERRKPLTS